MPELPEVETTRSGIEPHIRNKTIRSVVVRNPRLRWPIPIDLAERLIGSAIDRVERRGKYLLLYTPSECLMVHLGMSGSLRITAQSEAPLKHDHVDIIFNDGQVLRYCDPRRFGCMLLLDDEPLQHPLLKSLGPEPLSDAFGPRHLFTASRGKRTPIKTFIMDSHIVVGVGNIYANEALFMAGIKPKTMAGRVSAKRYEVLTECIKTILGQAILQGGTTLRDFVGGDGKPGYFKQQLFVYGRGAQPCKRCDQILKELRLAQRSTVYCPRCQS
ncbi:MAG: bifunctional DNA-formamidopyrimidine glycosylase/DNA-(apurinic or apyrimidinic site) lyase [Pseudohongiellaceae bacterium]|nr:bifunctional DNA-formamidopyrimidine glycosylase/DNA-(apurinic or apyrimidinic site) lyase [Pseudohongiellaceae bacterium]